MSGDVNGGAVLDIRAFADADAVDIAANDTTEPDAAIGADMHVANDRRTGRDEGFIRDGGEYTVRMIFAAVGQYEGPVTHWV